MTNETVLNSGDAGKAWLDEVQLVWWRVKGKDGGTMFLPRSFLIKLLCRGIAFTDIYVIKTCYE